MNPQTRPGLASIIVPCCGQLGFTRLCFASLVRHTRKPWELVVIDNGSTDGSAAYLAGVQDTAPVPVTIVSNARNLGFPAAVNQGLRVARGEYLILLNNDVVVTDAWLDQLVALVDSRPDMGLAGPMSNYVSPPQWVEKAPYQDMDEMHVFAGRWREEHRGQWFTVGKLSGFCLLMKRRVYETIGGLDERFGLGFFDDDDLAERARRAGFELAVAHDLFIHHFGSRTFQGNGIDTERLLEHNQQRFAEKWGSEIQHVQRVTLKPWSSPSAPGGQTLVVGDENGMPVGEAAAGPQDPRRTKVVPPARTGSSVSAGRPKVSLTMIVRDEEANLPACLSSVEGLFDEIVVVDTGSTDRTPEIAREFGARVFDFAWVDDFAAARNAALACAKGDYAFWLDADDVIDKPERERLETLLGGLLQGDEAAYVVRCACDPDHNSARTCAGRTESTNRSCPRCAVPMSRCDGPTSRSGTRDTPTRRYGNESSSAIARSSRLSWRSGPTIRSCSSTWARSPSSGRTGPAPWAICSAA
jgi:GT2 family glycosyltransferase